MAITWRDTRRELPTKADADEFGQVLGLYSDGSKRTCYMGCTKTLVAWAPTSELPAFDRIPDPPEGWRFVKTGEAFDRRAKFWYPDEKEWRQSRVTNNRYSEVNTYIVPIDPPEPQYRPFRNAAEFDGWAFNFWRYKDDLRSVRRPPMSYSDDGHYGDKWDVSLIRKEFADGTPFGVRVEC
jgi:hypothetical protein